MEATLHPHHHLPKGKRKNLLVPLPFQGRGKGLGWFQRPTSITRLSKGLQAPSWGANATNGNPGTTLVSFRNLVVEESRDLLPLLPSVRHSPASARPSALSMTPETAFSLMGRRCRVHATDEGDHQVSADFSLRYQNLS